MSETVDTSGIYPIKRPKMGPGALQSLEELNPALITAYYFFPPERWRPGMTLYQRTVTDYEFVYILASEGGRQVIDGTAYPVRQGDVFFRQPGQRTQGCMRYECICLIFSLNGRLPDLADYRINREKPRQEAFGNPVIGTLPGFVGTAGNEVFRSLFERIMRAFINPVPYSEVLAKGILTELIYRYLVKSRPGADGTNPQHINGAEFRPDMIERLEAARLYIHEKFSGKITVAEIASRALLSEAYFHKCFARAFGQTPAGYLASVRLERARELLAATDLPIRSIALETGFENDGYFYRFFARHSGLTPGAFRSEHRMQGM